MFVLLGIITYVICKGPENGRVRPKLVARIIAL